MVITGRRASVSGRDRLASIGGGDFSSPRKRVGLGGSSFPTQNRARLSSRSDSISKGDGFNTPGRGRLASNLSDVDLDTTEDVVSDDLACVYCKSHSK